MNRFLCVALVLLMMLSYAACGSSPNDSNGNDSPKNEVQQPQAQVPETAEDMLKALQEKNENITEILVWTKENDPNGQLGRPGNYIGKADFSDSRVEEIWTTEEDKLVYGLSGGTIEVFKSKGDCEKRCSYLKGFMGSDMGAFGLNQYVYKYDKVLFRVSYDVVPSAAEEYKTQMNEILNEEGEEVTPD